MRGMRGAGPRCIVRAFGVMRAAGADPNAEIQDGSTPLHLAAVNGHCEVVGVLLQHKANPTLKDKAGLTAADKARESTHVNVLATLSAASEAVVLDADETESLSRKPSIGSFAWLRKASVGQKPRIEVDRSPARTPATPTKDEMEANLSTSNLLN
eukprot:m.108986 g.108986  ORF g.108986 m.108986 type:complete len:155 (-) comp14296_c0_seq4:32-496(-)